MNRKLIYIIRHAETEYNTDHIIQGRGIDSDINEQGTADAARFYARHRDAGFEYIYTSELKRTRQSVQHFLDSGIPHEPRSELNEMNWGDYEGKSMTPALLAEIRALKRQWKQGRTHLAPPGGESPDQIAARLNQFLAAILPQPEEKILICLHRRSLRILLCILSDVPVHRMSSFAIKNLSLYAFEYTAATRGFQMFIHNHENAN